MQLRQTYAAARLMIIDSIVTPWELEQTFNGWPVLLGGCGVKSTKKKVGRWQTLVVMQVIMWPKPPCALLLHFAKLSGISASTDLHGDLQGVHNGNPLLGSVFAMLGFLDDPGIGRCEEIWKNGRNSTSSMALK